MHIKGILAVLAVTAFAAPALAMGSGGGYGGGFGGGNSKSGSFDEYSTALRLIHHDKFGEAISHLQSALADKPHSADILNYLGYTERMVGNYQYSLVYYQKALTEDPDHKGAHEYLGELYLDLKDLPNAQAQLVILQKLCDGSCDETDALTKSIAAYQVANATPATGATLTNTDTPQAPAAPATPADAAAPATPPAPATPAQ